MSLLAPVRDVYLPGDTPPRPRPTPPPSAAPPRPRRASRSGTSHPDQLTVCACQWGPTAHCLHGDHDRCRADEVAGPAPETYLTYADGSCVLAPAPVEVWLAGRPCWWMCSCTCHTTQPTQPAQPTLF